VVAEAVRGVSGWFGTLLTAILGVLVFVAGQAILRFVVEPVQEQKRLIGEVTHALLFYANRGPIGVELGSYPAEHLYEASAHLRDLAGRLRASVFYVPFYDSLARLGVVPTKEDALEAAAQLVGWSNSVLSERSGRDRDNLNRQRIIAEKLGITRRIGAVG